MVNMKKKLNFCLFMFFLIIVPLFSDELRFYSKGGYRGHAMAEYVGTTKNINPARFADEGERRVISVGVPIIRYCQKLSKQECFLLWSALEQWDYSNNEIYAVTIQQGKEILQLIVVVKDKNNCDWYGGWYVEDPT